MMSRTVGIAARRLSAERVDDVARDDAVGAAVAPRRARPASRCRRTPAHAAVNGSSPLASIAAITPDSTSPVPAVASAGAPPGLTADAAARARRRSCRRP